MEFGTLGFWRGLYSEGIIYGGKFAFQNQLASLIVGRKFTVFALFYFVFEGNFQVQVPRCLYLEGRFNEGFFALRVWGAYIWRGLFSKFYSILVKVLRRLGEVNCHTFRYDCLMAKKALLI